MKRRHFLTAAGASGALGLVSLGAPVMAAAKASAGQRFRILRLDATTGRFAAVDASAAPECGEQVLSLRLDALHGAEGTPVLQSFRLSALFDAPGAAQSPFHVWHFDATAPERASRGFRFLAGRATMRGFRIDYRLDGETPCSERCSAVAHALAPLQPGHYLLVGPRRDGRDPEAASLAYSGDPLRPLADAGRDFDYLGFRVEVPEAA